MFVNCDSQKQMTKGTRKKSYYAGDVGLAIQHIMRDLDWEERQEKYEAMTRTEECESEPISVDQEDEDWVEKLYERPVTDGL